MDIASVLLMLGVVLGLAKLTSGIFNRFGVPGLIGEILIGVLIANLVIGDFNLMAMLDIVKPSSPGGPSLNYELLEVIGELGVMFLLFAVGMETRVKDLTSVGKAAMLVAVLGVLVPFVLGFGFIMLYEGGHSLYHALFMGAAMVATSVGITARIIKDMKLTDTRESKIIIGAAVIDDILGILVLAIVSGMAETGGSVSFGTIAQIIVLAIVFVAIVMLLAGKILPMIYQKLENRRAAKLAADPNYVPYKINMFALSLIVCLLLAYIAN